MKRGTRPKSVKLKLLEGNPGHQNLKRLSKAEPMPDSDIPQPPEHLDPLAIEEWQRVTPCLFALGILANLDRGLLTAYCSSYSRYRKAEEELNKIGKIDSLSTLVVETQHGNKIQNTLIGISNKAAADFVKYGDMLGMGISARARLGLDMGQQKKSKFAGLINCVR